VQQSDTVLASGASVQMEDIEIARGASMHGVLANSQAAQLKSSLSLDLWQASTEQLHASEPILVWTTQHTVCIQPPAMATGVGQGTIEIGVFAAEARSQPAYDITEATIKHPHSSSQERYKLSAEGA